MKLRELIEALSEYDDDLLGLLDTEVLLEDEYGATSPITAVVEANGVFIHPALNFEEYA